MKISLFTPWNIRCGIADYSFYLKSGLEKCGLEIEVVPLENDKYLRNFIRIGKKMNNADIAHIQHEYSFFENNIMPGGLISFFLGALKYFFFVKQIKIPVVITLHELFLPKKAITFRAIKFVHRVIFSISAKNIVHRNAHRE